MGCLFVCIYGDNLPAETSPHSAVGIFPGSHSAVVVDLHDSRKINKTS